MSLFDNVFNIFRRTKLSKDASDGSYPGGPVPQARALSAASALAISTVWACQAAIGGTISTLPLQLFEQSEDGVPKPAVDHPLYSVLNSDPNYDLTSTEFWETMSAHIELEGNGYAEKVKNDKGDIIALNLIAAGACTVSRRRGSGELVYRYVLEGKRYEKTQEDILHIRGALPTALGGTSTLAASSGIFRAAANEADAARAAFDNGLSTNVVFSIDRAFVGNQRAETEELLAKKYVGSMRTGTPMLLDNGLKAEKISISPQDAQLLESRRFSIEEIARIFGVPPFMIGHSEKSTSWGKGLEQQILAFVKFTLRRRLKRIEKALEKQLLTPGERASGMYIRFNMEGLLRGDSLSRYKVYEIALRNGIKSVNEVRALEGDASVDGGDTPRLQMQMTPINESGGTSDNA